MASDNTTLNDELETKTLERIEQILEDGDRFMHNADRESWGRALQGLGTTLMALRTRNADERPIRL